jgi:hypothetical protein
LWDFLFPEAANISPSINHALEDFSIYAESLSGFAKILQRDGTPYPQLSYSQLIT